MKQAEPRGGTRSGCWRASTTAARPSGSSSGSSARKAASGPSGRAVNPQHRSSHEPRADDYVFEGYELDDALEAANGALEDDVSVLEQDGGAGRVAPFTRKEIVPRLERLFFRGGARPARHPGPADLRARIVTKSARSRHTFGPTL